MNLNSSRSFDCKNEELPVICRFCVISLTRDLIDFNNFSPMFDASYLATFKAKIDVVQELVQPKSETVALKVITERMYQTLDDLISPINHLTGYIELTGKQVPISSADFGLVQLRKSIRSRDVESVLTLLHACNGFIKKYKKELEGKGLTEALIAKFTEAGKLLAEDKDKKYALVSNRISIVQNNMGLLNELYEQLTEICRIGKVLYKQTDKAKLKDYTFAQMKKQVRRVEKPVEAKQTEEPAPVSA
jgi:hypothetical protein